MIGRRHSIRKALRSRAVPSLVEIRKAEIEALDQELAERLRQTVSEWLLERGIRPANVAQALDEADLAIRYVPERLKGLSDQGLG